MSQHNSYQQQYTSGLAPNHTLEPIDEQLTPPATGSQTAHESYRQYFSKPSSASTSLKHNNNNNDNDNNDSNNNSNESSQNNSTDDAEQQYHNNVSDNDNHSQSSHLHPHNDNDNDNLTQPSSSSSSTATLSHPSITLIHSLDEQSTLLQSEGKLLESLEFMEKSLILRGEVFGIYSMEVREGAATVCQMCNYLAMIYLSHSSLPITLELLKKAEILSQYNLSLQSLTYNNYSCYYRKTGKLRIALKYALKSIALEDQQKQLQQNNTHTSTQSHPSSTSPYHIDNKIADTHLNVCTILSELKRYHEAMIHAKIALKLLLLELFDEKSDNTQDNHTTENINESSAASSSSSSSSLPLDRITVLAIAYHNLAVQQEYLKMYTDSLISYEKAVKVVTTHLDPKHPLTVSMKQSLKDVTKKLSSKIPQSTNRMKV